MAIFPSTRHSVLDGLRSAEATVRRAAWGALVATYWKPAYKHARLKTGLSADDAADLVQGFFTRAIEKDFFAGFDPTRARFRTFLRVLLDRHAANEHKALTRQKRGGEEGPLSLDYGVAEAELSRSSPSPDEVFDLEWRRSVLERAVDGLRAACTRDGRDSVFTVFERYDLCDADARPTYAALGAALGLPVTTVTNQLAEARRALREQVLTALAEITTSDDELRDEARSVLGG